MSSWGLQRLDIGQILSEPVPEPDWLLDGLIERGELCWIAGAGKAGKSLVALYSAIAMLTGRPFCGRSTGRVQGVVYLDVENRDRTRRRRLHWALGDLNKRSQSRLEYFAGSWADLGSREALAKLEELTSTDYADMGFLVVLDSLIGLHRADEDSAREVRRFALGLRAVQEKTGATIIGLAHENRGGNMRGSLDWRNAADRVLELRKEKDGARTLAIGDTRDGDESAAALSFRFEYGAGKLSIVEADTVSDLPLTKREQLIDRMVGLLEAEPGVSRADVARRLGFEPNHGTFKRAWNSAREQVEEGWGHSGPTSGPGWGQPGPHPYRGGPGPTVDPTTPKLPTTGGGDG